MRRRRIVLVIIGCISIALAASAAPFIRGDTNQDGAHDIADAVSALEYLFGGGSTTCRDAVDVNDDGAVDIGDPIALLSYLFGGGPLPPPPFGECGDDPTADAVECTAFNPDICPDLPELQVTSIVPDNGPAEGGTAVTIRGQGFTQQTRAYLCDVALQITSVTSTRIDAVTPPGPGGASCDLRLTDPRGQAILTGAFSYAPECYTEADLQDLVAGFLGQPICFASPAYDGDVGGAHVEVCPESPQNTCTSGDPGCEAFVDDVDVTFDFDDEVITGDFTGHADIPIVVGATTCNTQFRDIRGTGTMDFSLAPTQWDGVYEITDLSNLVFTIDNMDISTPGGGLACALLELFEDTIQDVFEEEINNLSGDFEAELRALLVGSYACPPE